MCHPTIKFTLLLSAKPSSGSCYLFSCDNTQLVCLSTAAQGEERECAFTDQQQQWEVERVAGGEGRVSPENTTIRCAKGSHCFGLWEKSPPGEVRLVKQGTTRELMSMKCDIKDDYRMTNRYGWEISWISASILAPDNHKKHAKRASSGFSGRDSTGCVCIPERLHSVSAQCSTARQHTQTAFLEWSTVQLCQTAGETDELPL